MPEFPLSPVGETYLVGGAVRDELLGLEVRERDFVIVGGDEKSLLRAGFSRVGRDFPVFLHPQTKDEYALARTEKKTGRGYTGFTCNAAPDVTLAEDLYRRDLTINAMARKVEKTGLSADIIDPWQGQKDLHAGCIRHVSEAFVEDPLRVLRAARFLARYHHLGFRLAPDTRAMMQKIARGGELAELAAERCWQEMTRALMEKTPAAWFLALRDCDALQMFPAMTKNADIFALSLQSLRIASLRKDALPVRFAAMAKHWPVQEMQELASAFRWPVEIRELSLLAAKNHAGFRDFFNSDTWQPEACLDLLLAADALRRPERFGHLLLALCLCEKPANCSFIRLWQSAALAIRQKGVQDLLPTERTDGRATAAGMRRVRLAALSAWKETL